MASFSASLFVLRQTDLIGLAASRTVPQTAALGLVTFEVPLELPPLPIGLAWHPRHDADPAHVWLRACARELLPA